MELKTDKGLTSIEVVATGETRQGYKMYNIVYNNEHIYEFGENSFKTSSFDDAVKYVGRGLELIDKTSNDDTPIGLIVTTEIFKTLGRENEINMEEKQLNENAPKVKKVGTTYEVYWPEDGEITHYDTYEDLPKDLQKQVKDDGSINEAPMSFDGPERPSDDVQRQLGDKETPFSDNPGIPETGNEEDQSGEELLASNRFKEVVDKVKRLTGMESLPENPAAFHQIFMESIQSVLEFESRNKTQLEELAERLVKEELGSVTDNLEYELTLVSMGGIDPENFKTEEENPESADDLTEDEVEQELEAFELMSLFDEEAAKRRIINAFIQGSAMKGHNLIEKPVAVELLDGLSEGLGQELINKYAMIMALQELQYWTMPDMEGAVGGGGGQGGKEEVEHNEETGKWTVKAQAIMLPILVHEAIKGSMEVIGMHGLPDDNKMASAVIDQEDILYKEVWDLRIGPAIWDKFRQGLSMEVLDETDEAKTLMLYLLMDFFSLDAAEFLAANKAMLQGDYTVIEDIIDGIKRRFADDELNLQADEIEDVISTSFQNQMEDEDGVKFDDEFWDELRGMGLGKPEDTGFDFNLNEQINKMKKLI